MLEVPPGKRICIAIIQVNHKKVVLVQRNINFEDVLYS